MKVKIKAKELLEVVTLAKLKSDKNTGVKNSISSFSEEMMIKFNENNKIEVGGKFTEPVTMAFYFTYNIEDGQVIEEGEIAINLITVEKILTSFKDSDMLSIYTEENVLIFERIKPKKKVTYTPLEKKLVIGQNWKSDYKFDAQNLTLKRQIEDKEKEYEIAYASVNSKNVKRELQINSFTEYDKIHIVIKNGNMSMKLGNNLVFSESDMTTKVKGEFEADYAIGFDNIFSVLAEFGGDTDMVFLLSQKMLYILHNTDKFKFEALIPATME